LLMISLAVDVGAPLVTFLPFLAADVFAM